MQYVEHRATHNQFLFELFRVTFSVSDGQQEGLLIGNLVHALLNKTAPADLRVVTALDQDRLAGACIFSRLQYETDPRKVFILAPMAVLPDKQMQGIGQALIGASMQILRQEGVDLALTYGDPAFYGKTGFSWVSEKEAPAPFALQYPEGWLVKSLTNRPFSALSGPVRCVCALQDPVYW